jgi:CheY-like chemotaxis protein
MSQVQIVGLTAHAMKGDRERCLEAGMDVHIAKTPPDRESHRQLGDALLALRWGHETSNAGFRGGSHGTAWNSERVMPPPGVGLLVSSVLCIAPRASIGGAVPLTAVWAARLRTP